MLNPEEGWIGSFVIGTHESTDCSQTFPYVTCDEYGGAWDIGRMIDDRQSAEGWGTAVIPRLAQELKNELSEVKGFSERNAEWLSRPGATAGLIFCDFFCLLAAAGVYVGR